MRTKPDNSMNKLCSCYCDLVLSDEPPQDCGHEQVAEQIREGCKDLILTDTKLRQVMEKLKAQILLGLDSKTRSKSSVKCFNTYVQDLPTGKEHGKFLALDLGGTNFRVLLISLDERHFDMQSKVFSIPQEVMLGSGTQLFDHIAECLAKFMKEHHVSKINLPLGFTFSFPLEQMGLTKGILQRWTKGFNCAGVVGNDVVQFMKDAVKRRGDITIDIFAILNDTTGTLMSCAWKNHNCRVGTILGTGSNACYVERIENIPGFDGNSNKPYVIINTEWGAFGDNGELDFISTQYDKEVDTKSINPGKQIHEKMISGMYLGEIVRLLLVKFAKDKIIFNGKTGDILMTRGAFRTEFISDIESDKRGTFISCRRVLELLEIREATDQDCSNVRYVCECVSRRAAHLASAGIATLINKMAIPSVTVGVDGSLYRYHPHFHNLMMDKIGQLVTPEITNVVLTLASDGSGIGAALVAATTYLHKPTK